MGILLTGFLTMGLAACNNNDSNDVNDQTTNRVGMNTNNNDNDFVNVRNGRDDGIDHNGPLTEDYTNRDNNDSDWDRNMFDNTNKVKRNNDDMISAYQTNLNSSQYPHTRAVVIRDAKYQFIRIDPRSGAIQQGQPNTQAQIQNPKAIAPAPVPKQTQPAPKQTPPTTPKTTTQTPASTAGNVSQYVQQVIDLTNAQRSKNGLPALKADSQLNGVAQKKSVDMQQNNYFSHTSPTYGSPFDMMRDFGVTYKSAGENIAQGQRTPQEVVTAWMNSEGHRKNILSANFTHIGVGFEDSGKHWTQMFIGK